MISLLCPRPPTHPVIQRWWAAGKQVSRRQRPRLHHESRYNAIYTNRRSSDQLARAGEAQVHMTANRI